MKTIILSGGGTAGHITPSLALVPALEQYFDKIVYIGSGSDVEQKLLSQYKDVEYHIIPTAKLIRGLSLKNLLIPFALLKAKRRARALLKVLQPDVIFNKGGYAGLPIALAGAQLGIPIIAHESDLTLGLAHKLVKKKYQYICTSFDKTAQKLNNSVHTGTPIRRELISGNGDLIRQKYKLNKKPVLLVMGGSQGAQQINALIDENIDQLTQKYQIIHIRGRGKLNHSIHNNAYHQMEFCQNMGDVYAVSNLCITRGGSNSLHELLYNHIPMLIIPLQHNSRGDQIANAKYFERKNWAMGLYDKKIDNNIFLSKLEQLKQKSNTMHNATKAIDNDKVINKIVGLIVKTANKKRG